MHYMTSCHKQVDKTVNFGHMKEYDMIQIELVKSAEAWTMIVCQLCILATDV